MLFEKQGFDATTAAQIAVEAGVTERTFFRHFSNKREVLFDGEERVRRGLLSAINQAPADISVVATLFHAFDEFRPELEGRQDYAAPRQRIIDNTPTLQERELAKIASLTSDIAFALEQRGASPLEARLASQIGMAAFADATAEWLRDGSVKLSERFYRAEQVISQMTTAPSN